MKIYKDTKKDSLIETLKIKLEIMKISLCNYWYYDCTNCTLKHKSFKIRNSLITTSLISARIAPLSHKRSNSYQAITSYKLINAIKVQTIGLLL